MVEGKGHDGDEPFRLLFEQAGVGVAQLDSATGRFLRVNAKYCEILGYTDAELLELDFMRVTYPDDLAEDLANMARLVAGQINGFTMEKRLRQKDGDFLWVELTVSRTWRDGEPPLHHVAVVVDISMRKLTEAALHMLSTEMAHLAGEAFLHEATGAMAGLLNLEFGFVGRLLPGKPERIRMLGLAVDGQLAPPFEYDLAGTPCEAVVAKTACYFDRNVQAAFPSDHVLVELGISAYAAVPLFNQRGLPIGHVGVMSRAPFRHPEQVMAVLRLFAVRNAAEIERQESAARFESLFEFSPDAVIIVNDAGRITMANRSAVTLFGYTRDELLGLDVEALMPPGEQRAKHVVARRGFAESSVPRAMGAGRELRAVRKDGSTVPVDISLSPLQTEDGPAVVVAVRDVTERVRAEQERARLEAQRRQSEKMEAIGAFAGGIAHDFNNVLAVVFSNLDVVRARISTEHAAWAALDDIRLASEKARSLVRQILAFSRDQAEPRQIVSLRPIVEETAKLVRGVLPPGVLLTVELSGQTPDVMADPIRVHQVLMNLCTNASHALEGHSGRITLRLESVVLDEAAARRTAGLAGGQYVCVSVADDGKGMDAATAARAFEPFFTTKPHGEGTGLGLAMVQGIMQAHGGAIVVTSQPGAGSTFRSYFPVARP